MEQEQLRQLQEWHEAEEYQKVVDAIRAIPEEERGYELTSLLARAFNNLGHCAEAEALLLSVRAEGEGKALWHYRLGYAYYYQGKLRAAKAQFLRAIELEPEDKDAATFLRLCQNTANKADDPLKAEKILPERRNRPPRVPYELGGQG